MPSVMLRVVSCMACDGDGPSDSVRCGRERARSVEQREERRGRHRQQLHRALELISISWRCAWLAWLRHEPLDVRFADGGRVTYANPLPLVIDIVVDNHAPRAVEQRYRLRHGAARLVLRAALYRYCIVAGYRHLPDGCGAESLSGTAR